MRLILKNLWAHRKQNGWIFAEIAIITVLSWFMVDYLVVSNYGKFFCNPTGDFEKDHLCVGQFGELRGELEQELQERGGIPYEEDMERYQVLKTQLQNLPEVQSVCLTFQYIGEDLRLYDWRPFAPADDTLKITSASCKSYYPNEQFFETQGLRSIEGSPAAEVLSRELPQDAIIITRSLAEQLFGTDQVVGKRLAMVNNMYSHDGNYYQVAGYHTIAGVVEDVKGSPYERYPYMAFLPTNWAGARTKLLLRLKPDVDAEAFVKKHQPTLTHDFRAGSYVLSTLETYNQHFERQKEMNEDTLSNQLVTVPLTLFAIIVVLGTLGTYWLQIRKRKEDIGIMRAFGASKLRIFWTFLAEGAILTLLASLLGDFIWLQFAASWDILSDGNIRGTSGMENDWINQFWPHFLIISLVIFLLLLIIVSLGIALPAWNICRKKIVTALRDE
ncbi:MAG: ABC transporter permease [Bacteroidaceae bacterium]|nr:ABC transporter permease [Bacteroidaceae bacterium]